MVNTSEKKSKSIFQLIKSLKIPIDVPIFVLLLALSETITDLVVQ